jgi:branched-chain amino acid transport system ATP-binding protein
MRDEPQALCLTLDRVSRHFGGLKAVDEVSLQIPAGARHALIGPNGAGKTTLFNIISGEVRPTAGRVVLFGQDVTALPPYRRAAHGMARTFQVIRLFPDLTVMENALLSCEALDSRKFSMLRRVSAHPRLLEQAFDLLTRFGLWDLRLEPARALSYGDQRKLEVALSMAGRPRLLLLDEPMAGLSGAERHVMQGLLEQLDPTMAVLLIEHDMDVAFEFAERVTVLSQGRVLMEGTVDEVSANASVQQTYLGSTAGSHA